MTTGQCNTAVWRKLGSAMSTRVVVGTAGQTISGLITLDRSERLLDVLNHGTMADVRKLPDDFLMLSDVEIISADGLKKHVSPQCLLAKAGILFVAEKNLSDYEASNIFDNHSPFYQQKKAFRVEISLPSVSIDCLVHVIPWQRAIDVVNTERKFLPVTDGMLSGRLGTGDSHFGFMAVNRDQIIYVEELESQNLAEPGVSSLP
jgi:hypothetical protein